MKILVTGGLGTVGSYLVKELRARGHDVLLCDLPHHHDPQYYRCDVGEYRQLQRIFDAHSIDCVYHLAAEFGRWNGEDYYEALWRTNAVGTKHVIRLQEKHRFRLVHFSSSEVYGDYDGVMEEGVMEKEPYRTQRQFNETSFLSNSYLQMISSSMKNSDEEKQAFLKVFLRARGVISTVEKEMGISYPTVRARLDSLLSEMGLSPIKDDGMAKRNEKKRQILKDLEDGKLTAEQAKKKMRGLK